MSRDAAGRSACATYFGSSLVVRAKGGSRGTRADQGVCPTVLLLQILRVPGQVTLHAVLLVTGARDAVVLAGIDHQLRGHTQAAQRLVHLLRCLLCDGLMDVSLQ